MYKKIILVGKSSNKSYGGVEKVHECIMRELNIIYSKESVIHMDSQKLFIKYFFIIWYKYISRNYRILIIASGFSGLTLPLFPGNKKIFLLHGFYNYYGHEWKGNIMYKLKRFLINNFLLKILRIINPIFIAPSDVSAQINSTLLQKEKIKLIPWGGIKPPINVKPIDFKKRSYDFVYHGRINNEKFQPKIFYKIIKTISKLIPEYKIKIIISGSGDIDLAHDFAKKLKNELGDSQIEIDIFSYLKDYQVEKILCNSKFLINFHEWEAFGLSLIEGLQCGCQILVPNTTPILMNLKKESFIRFKVDKDSNDEQIIILDEIIDSFNGKEVYKSNQMSSLYINQFSWERCVYEILKL